MFWTTKDTMRSAKEGSLPLGGSCGSKKIAYTTSPDPSSRDWSSFACMMRLKSAFFIYEACPI